MGSVYDFKARAVVLEHEAADVVERLQGTVSGFDAVYRELEFKLATSPSKVGILGLVENGAGVGLYLHIWSGGAIDVLYRYDNHTVFVETVVVDRQVVRVAS